jgi:pre-mRNA-splicing factor CWC26
MSTLSSYLAKNYLTASTPSSSRDQSNGDRPKKRRKKDKSSSTTAGSTLVIADDDDLLLSGSAGKRRGEDDDDGGVGAPMMYEGKQRSAEFRRKKDSSWRTVTNESDVGEEADEADKILASAAADQDERRREVDMGDAPAIVSDNDDGHDEDGPKMESGVKAGLQTAEETKRLMEKEERQRRKDDEVARTRKKNKKSKEEEQAEETVYRDATGRRIDVSLRRAELRKQEFLAEQARRKEREDAMGEVQRRQKEERKEELDEARFLTLGRGADDEEMNERLKEVVRWDDPMAGYVAKRKAEEGEVVSVRESGRGGEVKGKTKTKGKAYQGHAPPNRYGILPGWRWDGVDRGNGFEKDWFQARSRSKRNEEMSYQWQMDE